jgi:hypothetical protein
MDGSRRDGQGGLRFYDLWLDVTPPSLGGVRLASSISAGLVKGSARILGGGGLGVCDFARSRPG